MDTPGKSTIGMCLSRVVRLSKLRARSSARIERWSTKPEVTGSNPVGRAILFNELQTPAMTVRLVLVPDLCRFTLTPAVLFHLAAPGALASLRIEG